VEQPLWEQDVFGEDIRGGLYDQRMRNDIMNQQGRVLGQQAANRRAALRGAQAAGGIGQGSIAGARGLAEAGEGARRQLGEAGIGLGREQAQSRFGLRREEDIMQRQEEQTSRQQGYGAFTSMLQNSIQRGQDIEDIDFGTMLDAASQEYGVGVDNLRAGWGAMVDALSQTRGANIANELGLTEMGFNWDTLNRNIQSAQDAREWKARVTAAIQKANLDGETENTILAMIGSITGRLLGKFL
jgi:hypothetical protein